METQGWALQTMQAINELTPSIGGKALDPGWFLLRQRLDQTEEELERVDVLTEELRIAKERIADLENGLTTLHLQFGEPYYSWQRVLYRVQQLIRRRNACAEGCLNAIGVLRGQSVLTTESLIQRLVDAVMPLVNNQDEPPTYSQGIAGRRLPEPPEPMRLIQDDDCHWYIIPEARQEDFYAWCKSMADCTAPPSDWEPDRVNGPASIRIFDFENLDA